MDAPHADRGEHRNPPAGPSPDIELSLEDAQLRDGLYLHTLETYNAEQPWSREKTARDIWQNFVDANRGTADGIRVDVREGADGANMVTVYGDAEYPATRLLSFGATVKADRAAAAGGKGEGTKMIALALLRDYGAERVTYASGDWELTFTLAPPPTAFVDAELPDVRGLYATLRELPPAERVHGNTINFTTRDRETAESIVPARDLFIHAANPDFAHPDVDTEVGGLRVLPEGQHGNFYLNGQRIAFGERDRWHTLPGFTMWSKRTPELFGRRIVLGRDRDLVTVPEVRDIFLPFLVAHMDRDDRAALLEVLDPYFDAAYDPDRTVGRELIDLLVGALEEQGYRRAFPNNYLADDLQVEEAGFQETLQQLGYRLCRSTLQRIGMPRASLLLESIRTLERREPSPEEQARMDLMTATVERFLAATSGPMSKDVHALEHALGVSIPKRTVGRVVGEVEVKPIALFSREHPYVTGRYDGAEVWMRADRFHDAHPDRAIATYLHELCHRFGSDQSAEFSYALTVVLGRWNGYLREHPEALRDLDRAWQAVTLPEQVWRSAAELESAAQPLIAAHRTELGAPGASADRFGAGERRIEDAASAWSHILQATHTERSPSAVLARINTIRTHAAVRAWRELVAFDHLPEAERASREERSAERRALEETAWKLRGRLRALEQEIIPEGKPIRGGKGKKFRRKLEQHSGYQMLTEQLVDVERRIQELVGSGVPGVPEEEEARIAYHELHHARLPEHRQEVDLFPLTYDDAFAVAAAESLSDTATADELLAILRTFPGIVNRTPASEDTLVVALERAVAAAKRDPSPQRFAYAKVLYDLLTKREHGG